MGCRNGLTVDCEGGVWVALFGGSAVRRYGPAGTLEEVLELPVTQVTACAFGGDADEQSGRTSWRARSPLSRRMGAAAGIRRQPKLRCCLGKQQASPRTPDSRPPGTTRGSGMCHAVVRTPHKRGLGRASGRDRTEAEPSTWEIAEGGSGSARASCPPSAQGAANDAACISQHLRPGDVEVRERYGHALTIKPSWSGVELSVSVSLMTGQPASGRRRDCGRWWRRRCGGPLGDELLDGQAPLVGHLDEERARPHAR
jgi:hypothetical protein